MLASGMNQESQNVQLRTVCQWIPVCFTYPVNKILINHVLRMELRLGMPRGKISESLPALKVFPVYRTDMQIHTSSTGLHGQR